jgi:hypothetical protein
LERIGLLLDPDIRLSEGLELLQYIKRHRPRTGVIIIAADLSAEVREKFMVWARNTALKSSSTSPRWCIAFRERGERQ